VVSSGYYTYRKQEALWTITTKILSSRTTRMVDNLNCDFGQRNKLEGKGYGFLPEREVQSIPFEKCVVDLIGTWTVQVHGKPYYFEALTVIDTVTN
jgi:hypothetical protein